MEKGKQIICPLCNDTVDKLLYRFHIENERLVIDRLKQDHPSWTENDGVCGRCVDYYQVEIVRAHRILPEIGPHFSIKSADDFIILPTGLRLNADPRFTGKGVTICFIDSGFYPHPDLTAHNNRIKACIDITEPGEPGIAFSEFQRRIENTHAAGQAALWHGTMTSVVCAGDGYLSNGLYKGIASSAELVLLKVQDSQGRISRENIVKALQWVAANHAIYGIRIVNISLGDDEAVSYKESEIDRLAEELISLNMIVVAAVGNDENSSIKPPANALHVIAVGGINDNNLLESVHTSYHSAYGTTTDGLMKPELVANAIWMAAPILPGSKEQKEAVTLYEWLDAGKEIPVMEPPENFLSQYSGLSVTHENGNNHTREAVIRRLQQCKYISPHYMHVDGTSFAAPVVCAVIAQLLEAAPQLTTAAIRHILFSTAKRLSSIAAGQQGFGVVQPRKAILQVLKKETILKPHDSPCINKEKKTIAFYVHNTCAAQISLAGSFNHWAQDVLLLEPHKNGIWKIEIPLLPAGRYQYKFLIDDGTWMEDTGNPFREPDGIAGFNSVLVIEN